MKAGTIERALAIVSSLIRGAVHDRATIAEDFGVTVARADRYIRSVASVPGVVTLKQGRRLTVRWSFTDAIRAAGL